MITEWIYIQHAMHTIRSLDPLSLIVSKANQLASPIYVFRSRSPYGDGFRIINW